MLRYLPRVTLRWVALCLVVALQSAHVGLSQGTIFVDGDAAGASNGSSWTDAFVYLQDALMSASPGDEVWVAEGVYLPDHGSTITIGDRGAVFRIPDGVAVFGGFAGNESVRTERNWQENLTILSGDLLGNDSGSVSADEPSRSDNAIAIVWISGSAEFPMVFDGFTVTGSHRGELVLTHSGQESSEIWWRLTISGIFMAAESR